jgi:hypothetical protein
LASEAALSSKPSFSRNNSIVTLSMPLSGVLAVIRRVSPLPWSDNSKRTDCFVFGTNLRVRKMGAGAPTARHAMELPLGVQSDHRGVVRFLAEEVKLELDYNDLTSTALVTLKILLFDLAAHFASARDTENHPGCLSTTARARPTRRRPEIFPIHHHDHGASARRPLLHTVAHAPAFLFGGEVPAVLGGNL